MMFGAIFSVLTPSVDAMFVKKEDRLRFSSPHVNTFPRR
jgi:hypothetical protein